MTLIIACLLIYHLGLPWWTYLIAAALWGFGIHYSEGLFNQTQNNLVDWFNKSAEKMWTRIADHESAGQAAVDNVSDQLGRFSDQLERLERQLRESEGTQKKRFEKLEEQQERMVKDLQREQSKIVVTFDGRWKESQRTLEWLEKTAAHQTDEIKGLEDSLSREISSVATDVDRLRGLFKKTFNPEPDLPNFPIPDSH